MHYWSLLACRWVSIRSPCAATERKSPNRRSSSSWTATLWTTVIPRQVRRGHFLTVKRCLRSPSNTMLSQGLMEGGPSSMRWRKATLWCLPATTSRTASCGSRPCTAPLASPTSLSLPLRSRNSTRKGAPRPKWTLPSLSSVSSPQKTRHGHLSRKQISSTKQ